MKNLFLIALVLLIGPVTLFAQDQEASASAAQANNPLANMTAFNVQNYYIPKLANSPADAYLNTAWLRFATPFAKGRLLLRVSLPLSTIGMPDSTGRVKTVSGLGDANAFLSYNFISKPSMTVGIGPQIAAPTATDSVLGAGKWQGGLAFVAFVAKSPVIQFGGLITWQASFAGDKDRPETNILAVQPFYFWQLGKGVYLRGAPVWVFDLRNSTYQIPVGLGIGKVVNVGKTVFNLFLEPQYTMVQSGVQPQIQLFAGINMQFIKKSR